MYCRKLVCVFLSFMFNYSYAADVSTHQNNDLDNTNKSNFHVGILYLKPGSNNLDYAYFVSGMQPYNQSWHSQMLIPEHAPAFESGFTYAIPKSSYSASVEWMHLRSSDAAYKQASESTDTLTIEFVAPPFEMSPPVFGIKRADSNVKFNFDNIDINVNKSFEVSTHVRAKLFGGVNVLRINQKITTVFSDFAGVLPTFYSYALPADPSYSFQLQANSKYVGAGPDLGLNVEYDAIYGFGLVGQVFGTVTAGTTSTQEQFTSTSARLTSVGIGTSKQEITTPNKTQVVPGVDGKLGVFYHYSGKGIATLALEGGYRLLSYANAITTISPGTLVQPSVVMVTPEFATGTMAIVSIDKRDRPFNMNGPYLDLKITMD